MRLAALQALPRAVPYTARFMLSCIIACCTRAGSLPTSWSNLSAVTPTTLLLAGNQLTGGIPAEWGNRTSPNTGVVPGGLLWAQLDVANNSRMCGPVPAWFYGAIALGNATLARQLLQGA